MNSTKTIGIIGGGQLGQMMAIAAIYRGHKVITLDPAANCPAARVSEVIVAPYDDVAALRQLAERCDVLTYEFENVDADSLDAVADLAYLPQGTRLLRISQNRVHEKEFLSSTGVDLAPYRIIRSSADLTGYDFSTKRVLKTAIVPARISQDLADRALQMARTIATEVQLSGTLCIEMFVAGNQILVNEIAPRPHNSGHYSIEACDFSQFDTHILGILGQPLPEVPLHAPAVMLNILGQHMEKAAQYVAEHPSAHLHLYGKMEAKHNRKMGHVTVFSEEPDEVRELGEGIDF